MPLRNVNTTLGKEPYGARGQIQQYLECLKELKLANVLIKSGNTEISLDENRLKFPWPRRLEAVMTTRLEGERLERFYESLPNFLRKTEGPNLNITYSEHPDSKDPLSFYIRFVPGQAVDKHIVRDQKAKTIVAEAKILGGYSGTTLDGSGGYLLASPHDVESRRKYLEMAIAAEKLGFIRERSDPEPEKGKCLGHVCVNPWEMVEQEFVDFTSSIMQRKETQELALSSVVSKVEEGRRRKSYDFKAVVLPRSNNVEVTTVGWSYPLDISNMFGESLNLFGVKLRDSDKVSYLEYYEQEHKSLEALANGASKIGGGVKASFAFLGGGISSAADAVKDKWREYKNNQRRSIEEVKMSIREDYGIESNMDRSGSCIVFGDLQCLRRNVEKKKAEKVQTAQTS